MKILLYITAPLDIEKEVEEAICFKAGFRYWKTGKEESQTTAQRFYMKCVNDGDEIPLTLDFLKLHNLGLYQVAQS